MRLNPEGDRERERIEEREMEKQMKCAALMIIFFDGVISTASKRDGTTIRDRAHNAVSPLSGLNAQKVKITQRHATNGGVINLKFNTSQSLHL